MSTSLTISRLGSLFVLVVFLAPLVMVAVTGFAETYRVKPLLVIGWDFVPRKGFIHSFKWSPGGDRLAIVVQWLSPRPGSEILVYTPGGRLVWRSGDLGGALQSPSVVWSSDGRFIAVSLLFSKPVVIDTSSNKSVRLPYSGVRGLAWSPTGAPRLALGAGSRLVVVSADGKELFSRRVGGTIYGVKWSPRGDLIALNLGNKVVVLSVDGRPVGSYNAGKALVKRIEWSPRGGLLAVMLKYGDSSWIVVTDSRGSVKWSTPRGRVYDYAWSPGGQGLLVAEGAKLVLYSPQGRVAWSFSLVKGIGAVSSVHVAWSRDASLVAVTTGSELLLLDPVTGSLKWRGRLGIPGAVDSIGWGADKRLALLFESSKHRKLVVMEPPRGLAEIRIAGCKASLLCSVSVSDGRVMKRYGGTPNGSLVLYATPGDYELVFSIGALPSNYHFVGNTMYLEHSAKASIKLHVEPGKTYRVSVPVDKLVEAVAAKLARLVIKAPEGTTVVVATKLGTVHRFKVTGGELVLYLAPGTYTLRYRLPGAPVEKPLATIRAEPGTSKTLTVPLGTGATATSKTSPTGTTQSTVQATTTGKQTKTRSPSTTKPTASTTSSQASTIAANSPIVTKATTTTTTGKKGKTITTTTGLAIALVLVLAAAIAVLAKRS